MATRDSAAPAAAFYEQHHDFVRRTLRHLGVAEADLDDVCHDVFLVVHAKANEVRGMANPGVWLHEVARRTASAHRRRAFRRSEIPCADPEGMAALDGADPGIERASDGKLRDVLMRLDPQRSETLLYSDLTDLSVSDLAVLLDCDRKTARKRLLAVRQRLGRWLSDPGAPSAAGARVSDASGNAPLFDPRRIAPVAAGAEPSSGLQVVAQGPMFAAAVQGRVFMTVWRRASLEEIETMVLAATRVYHATGGQFAYLTLVEAGCPPPAFSSRSRLAQIVREARSYLCSYATVLTGGPSAFVVPIMNVVFFLTGPAFPARFFRSVTQASAWTLERTGFDMGSAELAKAFEDLRQCLGP